MLFSLLRLNPAAEQLGNLSYFLLATAVIAKAAAAVKAPEGRSRHSLIRLLLFPFALHSFLLEALKRPDRTLKISQDAPYLPSGEWSSAKPIPSWRYEFGVAAVGEDVYAVGGLYAPTVYTVTGRVEVYNAKEDSWRRVKDLPVPVHHPGVVSCGGRLYVAGGNGFRINAYAQLYEYIPEEGEWSRKRDMPTARGALGVAEADGLIYAAGGAYPLGWKEKSSRGELEAYHPKEDRWYSLSPMPTPREHLVCVSSGKLIFALGGYNHSMFAPLRCNEVYDTASGKWEERTPLPLALCGFTAVSHKGSIFVFGGEQGWAVSGRCYEYKIHEDRWYGRPDMPGERYAAAACAVKDRIYVIGGKQLMFGHLFLDDNLIFKP